MTQLKKSTLDFLKQLDQNNNREWFTENKSWYVEEHENAFNFAEALLNALKEHDQITTVSGKKSLMRVYRDVRFSKDKSPYKTHVGAIVSKGGRKENVKPGFYIQIEQSSFHLGGGCYVLPKQELLNLRMYLIDNYDSFLKIIQDKTFVKHFRLFDNFCQ